jgi:hypothetical protein
VGTDHRFLQEESPRMIRVAPLAGALGAEIGGVALATLQQKPQ